MKCHSLFLPVNTELESRVGQATATTYLQILSSSWPSSGPTAVGKRRQELRESVCVPDSGGGIGEGSGCGRAFCVWCVGGNFFVQN